MTLAPPPSRIGEISVCRHCGEEIIRACDRIHFPGICFGWKHTAWIASMPIGAHYCGGRSIAPSAEPGDLEDECDGADHPAG